DEKLTVDDIGDCDGSLGDKIYFVARSNHGKFITIDTIMSISRGKFQRMSNLFASASLEDLTRPGKNPLRKRTKSQTHLLALAGTESSESTENSPVVSKKEPIVDLIKMTSSPLLSKVGFSSLSETRKTDNVKMRLNYESARTAGHKNRNSNSSSGLRGMNLKHLEAVASQSNRRETSPDSLNSSNPDSSNLMRNSKTTLKTDNDKIELQHRESGARSLEDERPSANAASNSSSQSNNASSYPGCNNEDAESLSSDLHVDSRVVFFDDSGIPLHGTIKYIGTFDDVIQVGVELDARITESDGNFRDGKKVFDCPSNKGLLCRPEELIKEDLMEMQMNQGMGKIIVDTPFYSAPEVDQNQNVVMVEKSDDDSSSARKKKERSKSSVGEEHFSCPICLDTVEEAVETTCCHQIFCEKCIRKHREISCPKCRKQPFTIIVSHFVRKLVGNFYMECTNDGCYHILTRSDMKYHKEKCAFEKIRCPNDGCKAKVIRSSLDEHLKMCSYSLVKCRNKGCLLRVTRQDLVEHNRRCDYMEVTCSNEGCHVTMIRLKLSRHLRESCRYMIASCPVPGCRYKSTGSTLGEHLSSEHYEMFMRHLDELKALYAKDQDAIFTVKWSSTLSGDKY
uniref:RING-type E3 ubiquitin transferase n=1 Tax=Clytia hemisphaerica TaxID=252671 RepID=A0A7M5UMH6_9CNID